MRNPFTGNYTSREITKMRAIHEHYSANIGGELPGLLEMDKEYSKPRQSATKNQFAKAAWISRMGGGSLSIFAEEMLDEICTYQTERHQRTLSSGYLDDPNNLFCEEFKQWLVDFLSHAGFTEETKEIVEKRSAYITGLDCSDLFQSGRIHTFNMLTLLTKLRMKLERYVQPKIETELANSSAREHFQMLIDCCEQALNKGLPFLYYIFRSAHLSPTSFSIEQLRRPSEQNGFAQAMSTRTGLYLQQLVKAPFLNLLYPDGRQMDEVALTFESQSVTSNPFLNTSGNTYLPAELLTAEMVMASAYDYLNSPDSGFESTFYNNEATMNLFMKCHGLFYELAKFIFICKKAKLLAGMGGDLLVYGLSNRSVQQLLNTYKILSESLRKTLESLKRTAGEHYDKLVQDRKAKGGWIANYRLIERDKLVFTILDKLKESRTAIDQIMSRMYQISLKQRLDRAREETVIFTAQTEQLSDHLGMMLGLPPRESEGSLLSSQARIISLMPPIRPLETTASITQPSQPPITIEEIIGKEDTTLTDSKPAAEETTTIKAESESLQPIQEPSTTAPALLKKLDFSGTQDQKLPDIIIPGIITTLEYHPEIEVINLEQNLITGMGIGNLCAKLEDHSSLRKLFLYQNPIGLTGATAISQLLNEHSTITHLDINETGLGSEGVRIIAAGLQNNTSLSFLDIGFNEFGDTGMLFLKEALQAHPTISDIRLGGNRMSDKGALQLLTLLQTNRQITYIELGVYDDPTDKRKNPISAQMHRELIAAVKANCDLRNQRIECGEQVDFWTAWREQQAIRQQPSLGR
jgi:hypothetical protein